MGKKILKGLGIGFGVVVAFFVLIMLVGSDEDYHDKIDEASAKEVVESTEEPTQEAVTESTETEVAEVAPVETEEETTENQPWLQDSGDYGVDEEDLSSTPSTSGTCDYIAAFDDSIGIPMNLYVTNHGNYSVSDIYEMVNDQIETNHYGPSDYSDSFIRDLSSIGLPMNFSGVTSMTNSDSDNPYVVVTDSMDINKAVVVDLSYLGTSTVIFQRDNVSLTGIYLGLNSANIPVVLATEINVY